MKKTFLSLFLVLILLVAATPFSQADEVKHLSMLWFVDGQEGVVMQGLIDEYEATHPNIEIEMIEVAYADLNNKVTTMLSANEQPALARMTNIIKFADYCLPLNEYIGEDFSSRFAKKDGIMFGDQCLGATMEYTAAGVIYNKTAFEKAGVSVPTSAEETWTFDEFKEALKTVMEKGGVKYGLVVDKTMGRYINFMYAAGGRLMNDDFTASAFNSDQNRRALQYLVDMHNEGIIPSGVWLGNENANTMFRSGQVAAHIGGSWLLTSYDSEITDFEWGVTYLPKEELFATQSAGKYLVAFKGTGVEKEAAEFIDWFSTPEITNRYLEPNFFISNLVAKAETPSESKYADAFAVFSEEIAADNTKMSKETNTTIFVAVGTDFLELISSALAGEKTVDEAITEMDELVTEAIADQN